MSRLKPCPFCGGEAEFEHSYREDGHRYPRDFWHVRIVCAKCFHETEWEEYGKMVEDAKESCHELGLVEV